MSSGYVGVTPGGSAPSQYFVQRVLSGLTITKIRLKNETGGGFTTCTGNPGLDPLNTKNRSWTRSPGVCSLYYYTENVRCTNHYRCLEQSSLDCFAAGKGRGIRGVRKGIHGNCEGLRTHSVGVVRCQCD